MSKNKSNDDTSKIKEYVDKVVDWATGLFYKDLSKASDIDSSWGSFYDEFHRNSYDVEKINEDLEDLMGDNSVGKKSGIYKYLLLKHSGNNSVENKRLLEVRLFSKQQANEAYKRQTNEAKKNGCSNCPDCALQGKTEIFSINEMETDHVTPWRQRWKY